MKIMDFLRGKIYYFTEDELQKLCNEIAEEVRKELEVDHLHQLEDLQKVILKTKAEYRKLEKTYINLNNNYEILKLEKLQKDKKVENDSKINRLTAEIFGDELR